MAADSIHIRMARLEGAYEQIDKRLTELRDDLRSLGATLGARMDSLERRLDRLEGRMDMVLYGIAFAILVPIFIRVFFR